MLLTKCDYALLVVCMIIILTDLSTDTHIYLLFNKLQENQRQMQEQLVTYNSSCLCLKMSCTNYLSAKVCYSVVQAVGLILFHFQPPLLQITILLLDFPQQSNQSVLTHGLHTTLLEVGTSYYSIEYEET